MRPGVLNRAQMLDQITRVIPQRNGEIYRDYAARLNEQIQNNPFLRELLPRQGIQGEIFAGELWNRDNPLYAEAGPDAHHDLHRILETANRERRPLTNNEQNEVVRTYGQLQNALNSGVGSQQARGILQENLRGFERDYRNHQGMHRQQNFAQLPGGIQQPGTQPPTQPGTQPGTTYRGEVIGQPATPATGNQPGTRRQAIDALLTQRPYRRGQSNEAYVAELNEAASNRNNNANPFNNLPQDQRGPITLEDLALEQPPRQGAQQPPIVTLEEIAEIARRGRGEQQQPATAPGVNPPGGGQPQPALTRQQRMAQLPVTVPIGWDYERAVNELRPDQRALAREWTNQMGGHPPIGSPERNQDEANAVKFRKENRYWNIPPYMQTTNDSIMANAMPQNEQRDIDRRMASANATQRSALLRGLKHFFFGTEEEFKDIPIGTPQQRQFAQESLEAARSYLPTLRPPQHGQNAQLRDLFQNQLLGQNSNQMQNLAAAMQRGELYQVPGAPPIDPQVAQRQNQMQAPVVPAPIEPAARGGQQRQPQQPAQNAQPVQQQPIGAYQNIIPPQVGGQPLPNNQYQPGPQGFVMGAPQQPQQGGLAGLLNIPNQVQQAYQRRRQGGGFMNNLQGVLEGGQVAAQGLQNVFGAANQAAQIPGRAQQAYQQQGGGFGGGLAAVQQVGRDVGQLGPQQRQQGQGWEYGPGYGMQYPHPLPWTAANELTRFYGQTVPTLAERFTAMPGGQRSAAFQGAVGGAGRGLGLGLAALGEQTNLAMQPLMYQNQQYQQNQAEQQHQYDLEFRAQQQQQNFNNQMANQAQGANIMGGLGAIGMQPQYQTVHRPQGEAPFAQLLQQSGNAVNQMVGIGSQIPGALTGLQNTLTRL